MNSPEREVWLMGGSKSTAEAAGKMLGQNIANTMFMYAGGGGNSMVGGPVTGRGNINRLMSILKMIDLESRSGMLKNNNVIDVVAGLYNSGYDPENATDNHSYRYQELDADKWIKGSFNGVKYEYQFISNYNKDNGGRGVRLALRIKSPRGYTDVDFIQTYERFGDGARSQTVDTDPGEPNLPYYWSKHRQKGVGPFPSVHENAGPGYSHYFDDTPGTLLRQKITFSWTAELSLVGKKNGVYKPIITFLWGYHHFESGDTTYFVPFPIPLTNPSDFHKNTVNSLNTK